MFTPPADNGINALSVCVVFMEKGVLGVGKASFFRGITQYKKFLGHSNSREREREPVCSVVVHLSLYHSSKT